MSEGIRQVPHWINGAEVIEQAGAPIAVTNPATGKVIAQVREASAELLDQAIAGARAAQLEWAQASLPKRAAVMYQMRQLLIDHAEEIADLIVAEGGKTHGDALGEIARGRETVEFACSITSALKGEHTVQAATGVDVHTVRQPVGVVAGICPFNFPVMVPMWMHPLALATGNAFVLKPATPVPSASLFIAKLYQEAGLPDGLFQVVCGDREVVTGLLNHDGVAAISFVGSTPVAKIVAEIGTKNGKRVQALGGANNHAIVMPDADLDFAAQHISAGAFGAAGQRCMALPVVIAVGAVAETLAEKVKNRAVEIAVGPGTEASNEMGPVISQDSRDRIVSWLDEAEAQGAQMVLDGRRFTPHGEGLAEGYWLGPTIVDKVTTDSRLYCNEVFGPVLKIVRAADYAEAIEIMNSSPFGNGAAIFTNSGGVARQFQLDAQAGMVGVNVPIPVPVGYYSFGGWKDSLLGDVKIHGPEGVNFYTMAKVITSRWPDGPATRVGMNFVETK